jgi:hypothetical protein
MNSRFRGNDGVISSRKNCTRFFTGRKKCNTKIAGCQMRTFRIGLTIRAAMIEMMRKLMTQ